MLTNNDGQLDPAAKVHQKYPIQLNLHTLKYRRLRGDMIEVYKIIRQIYDSSVAPNLQLGNAR